MAETIVASRRQPDAVRKRSSSARRSAREWGIRGIAFVIAAGLAFVSMAGSFADVLTQGDPELAHMLAPGNGQVSGFLAKKRFLDRPDQPESGRLARLAIQQDPTAIQALVTLGLQAQMKHDIPAARQFFAYSQRLSRRDLQTQLWAIEDAVSRGAVVDALSHYDIALRTSDDASGLLFPVLSHAIAEPAVRTRLVRILAEQPAWGTQFISYLASNTGNARVDASFFAQLLRAGFPLSSAAVASAVGGLLAEKAYDSAWQFYASVRPNVDRRRSRDPQFSAEFATPAPFDWTTVGEGGINSSIQRDSLGRGVFEFSVPPSVGGTLIHQTQMLPPGEYRLEGHAVGIDQPSQSSPYWVLICQDGQEVGRVEMPRSVQDGGRFAGKFNIPAACVLQTLALVARASDSVAGSTGQIDRVRLFPSNH